MAREGPHCECCNRFLGDYNFAYTADDYRLCNRCWSKLANVKIKPGPTKLERELVKALKEADSFIRDLVVLLRPPVGTVEYFHGKEGPPKTREESIEYTVRGALDFLDKLDIKSFHEAAS